ncbi:glycosyl hydrolase family 8 [Enterococcus timonensis]|uniref:glycosyl hydrolase family 8 n=1 Tax=Enterococcus timonensis TaxID=1852364 RepID=UPI0008DA4E38|nr:glycosyl hydrolase family 8 [Enterococcus timonensis]
MTKVYRNFFSEIQISEKEIEQRKKEIWEHLFVGKHKIYFTDEIGGYVLDTGNHDVRSEGMSYAMMLAVQYDRKDVFDKLWTWAKFNMYLTQGPNQGYFAWSVWPSGEKNSNGPAPDGEEYFAMALFFASHRFGDDQGIYHYENQAREILATCLHQDEKFPGYSMWNQENKLIKFVPNVDFSDPSYHLPHFYQLFSYWANEEDRSFWKEASSESRKYLVLASHPITGLSAEYAEYDGTPKNVKDHDRFFSDAYRVAANIGLDAQWFGKTKALSEVVERLQKFLAERIDQEEVYYIDGTLAHEKVLHPIGLIASSAEGSLALENELSKKWAQKFWDTPLRVGDRRYYDNFLYAFSFLALSGNYRIYGEVSE